MDRPMRRLADYAQQFPIPMRGNERAINFGALTASSKFPIPMRGNEFSSAVPA